MGHSTPAHQFIFGRVRISHYVLRTKGGIRPTVTLERRSNPQSNDWYPTASLGTDDALDLLAATEQLTLYLADPIAYKAMHTAAERTQTEEPVQNDAPVPNPSTPTPIRQQPSAMEPPASDPPVPVQSSEATKAGPSEDPTISQATPVPTVASPMPKAGDPKSTKRLKPRSPAKAIASKAAARAASVRTRSR